jgi:hypothetical protein
MSVAPRAGNGKITVPDILARKSPTGTTDPKSRITCLTAYDYPTARLLDEAGVDILLVRAPDHMGCKASLPACVSAPQRKMPASVPGLSDQS